MSRESVQKNTVSGETTHPGKKTIQVLIFAAGLLIGPLLSLGKATPENSAPRVARHFLDLLNSNVTASVSAIKVSVRPGWNSGTGTWVCIK